MSDKTGGPAFPVPNRTNPQGLVEYSDGMTLLDWLAGQETLAELDHPDASYGDKLAFSFAGPKPPGGWAEDPRGMFEWEAKVRAGMKYTRADAMLAEKARREATCKYGLQVPDHSPDAGKMAMLEEENRELAETLIRCVRLLEVLPDEYVHRETGNPLSHSPDGALSKAIAVIEQHQASRGSNRSVIATANAISFRANHEDAFDAAKKGGSNE